MPSTSNTGSSWVVAFEVSKQPPWSIATSTIALGNATLPYLLALADKGWREACRENEHLLAGLNTHMGRLTNYPVGQALAMDVLSPRLALAK